MPARDNNNQCGAKNIMGLLVLTSLRTHFQTEAEHPAGTLEAL